MIENIHLDAGAGEQGAQRWRLDCLCDVCQAPYEKTLAEVFFCSAGTMERAVGHCDDGDCSNLPNNPWGGAAAPRGVFESDGEEFVWNCHCIRCLDQFFLSMEMAADLLRGYQLLTAAAGRKPGGIEENDAPPALLTFAYCERCSPEKR